MRCLKKENILPYLDKEFSVKKSKKVRKHFEICPKCQENLKDIQKKIEFIKHKTKILNPDILFKKEFDRSFLSRGKRGFLSSGTQWIRASLRIPVPALLVLGMVFFLLIAGIFLQFRHITQLKSLLPSKMQTTDIYRIVNNHIKAISLDVNLDGFQPIDDPKIFVTKEK